MIIDVLVCRLDGTQVLEQREVPDDWFSPAPPEEAPDAAPGSGDAPES